MAPPPLESRVPLRAILGIMSRRYHAERVLVHVPDHRGECRRAGRLRTPTALPRGSVRSGDRRTRDEHHDEVPGRTVQRPYQRSAFRDRRVDRRQPGHHLLRRTGAAARVRLRAGAVPGGGEHAVRRNRRRGRRVVSLLAILRRRRSSDDFLRGDDGSRPRGADPGRRIVRPDGGLAGDALLPAPSSSASSWRSPRRTSSSNGGRLTWSPPTSARPSSARRATRGTRSGTCSSVSVGGAVGLVLLGHAHDRTTDRWRGSERRGRRKVRERA